MGKFENNVINLYSEKGKAWLANIPYQLKQLSTKWNLSDLTPLPNLSYHYILSGLRYTQPIILKLSLDIEGLKQESAALNVFSGFGAAKILAQSEGAILLERAVPGVSLKSYFPEFDREAASIACNVIKTLHQAPLSNTHFPHISGWLLALDKDWDLPHFYLKKAKAIKHELLKTLTKPVLLHGDLHHDNILQMGNNWISIDPKGVIGETAYEAAAFIRNPIPELLKYPEHLTLLDARISIFSSLLNIDAKRIKKWCFVQGILTWIWAIEDGYNTRYFQNLTEIYDKWSY